MLALSQLTNFPALTTKIVKTKFYGRTNTSLPHIATIACQHTNLLQGGPALIRVTDDGFCTVAITNCAPYDIDIERGVVVGVVETEDLHSNIEQLLQSKIKSVFDTIN